MTLCGKRPVFGKRSIFAFEAGVGAREGLHRHQRVGSICSSADRVGGGLRADPVHKTSNRRDVGKWDGTPRGRGFYRKPTKSERDGHMAEIVFEKAGKRYADGFEAVKSLDLTVCDGEFLVVVGPSGCGKSTALRMVAGLEDITSGLIRIGGQVVNEMAPRDRNIAMVFQSYALYPHLSIRDNIGFGLRVRGLDRESLQQRVVEVARILELEPYLDRKPAQLSGGQRQRVAMGRAIARSPNAFLMDEPLSNLDAKLRVAMRAEVIKLQRLAGITTIYVTHDQVEAMTMGDRVAVLDRGELSQLGTPKALYRNPANLFVAGFIGSPAMNFLPCKVGLGNDDIILTFAGQSLLLPLARFAALASAAGKNIIVGIRPEHLSIGSADQGHVLGARLARVEELGASLLLYLTTGPESSDILASVDSDTKIAIGEMIALSVSIERLHFFDLATGLAITIAS
jgi:multiple sugar transport system ATP-binding protein